MGKKLNDTFRVWKNLILERARFNQRKQEKRESFENFILALHQAADSCEFGAIKDQIIQDRLVIGI